MGRDPLTKRGDGPTDDDTNPETIDPDVTADEVARHLARCASCRSMLERARTAGPQAMDVWRREFAKCFATNRLPLT